VSSGTCEILDVGVETAPPAELLRRIRERAPVYVSESPADAVRAEREER